MFLFIRVLPMINIFEMKDLLAQMHRSPRLSAGEGGRHE
jgi:hypothetical protein